MKSAKQEAEAMIAKLPEDCSLEDIQYQLYVHEKIQRGLDSAKARGTVPQEQAEARLGQWLAK
ncbi:MAG: hypothetical protein JHC34_08465 [Acidobacteria bacterium]|jgi:hypothetical protein|nr:hypothetical protein [Acidobacteriota bacterium]